MTKKTNYFEWAVKGIDFNDKIVCDIGVGPGFSSIYYCELNPEKIYAIEPSLGIGSHNTVYDKLIENISKNNLTHKIEPLRIDFLKNNFEDNYFDITIGLNSLHHVIEISKEKVNLVNIDKRLDTLFAEMKRITKKDGKIVIWDLHSTTIWKYFPIRWRNIDWYLHPSLNTWIEAFERNFDGYQLYYQHILRAPSTETIFNNKLSNMLLNPLFKVIINNK